jgi:hypothetical protein
MINYGYHYGKKVPDMVDTFVKATGCSLLIHSTYDIKYKEAR